MVLVCNLQGIQYTVEIRKFCGNNTNYQLTSIVHDKFLLRCGPPHAPKYYSLMFHHSLATGVLNEIL